jgi:hypothetical protein
VRDLIKGGNNSRESRWRGPKVVRARLTNPADASTNSENGIMRADPDNEKSFSEEQTGGDVKPSIQLPGRLMLTITILALIFITIITWLISRMPEK